MKKKEIITLLLLLVTWGGWAQSETDAVFKMTKEDGHFFLETSVNGINARLMLESGVPGLMMSEAFYEIPYEWR